MIPLAFCGCRTIGGRPIADASRSDGVSNRIGIFWVAMVFIASLLLVFCQQTEQTNRLEVAAQDVMAATGEFEVIAHDSSPF